MWMRETRGSMRAYFLLVGFLGAARAIVILILGDRLDIPIIVSLIVDLNISAAFILCGLALRRLLASSPGIIKSLLYGSLATRTPGGLLLFAKSNDSRDLIAPGIGALISVYLLFNVNRLAREAAIDVDTDRDRNKKPREKEREKPIRWRIAWISSVVLLVLALVVVGSMGLGLWKAKGPTAVAALRGNGSPVRCVAFSPDGKTLAAGCFQEIKLWDVPSRTLKATLKGHTVEVHSVAFSPDGKTLASGSGSSEKVGVVKLWDVDAGMEQANLTGHTESVAAVAFSPDGKTLVSAGYDKTIKLWNVQTREEKATFRGHKKPVHSVAFSPDGRILAAGGGRVGEPGEIKLWDLNTDKEQANLTGHTLYVKFVAFSPDGKTLASAGDDQTIKWWDVQTGKEQASFSVNTPFRLEAFSPDLKTLAATGHYHTILLWDLQTKKVRATLKGHRVGVHTVAFSQDGKIVASGSDDGTVMLWE
jgi:dipeptidyl aminopeptidase/acylaminoacyl peptidase